LCILVRVDTRLGAGVVLSSFQATNMGITARSTTPPGAAHLRPVSVRPGL